MNLSENRTMAHIKLSVALSLSESTTKGILYAMCATTPVSGDRDPFFIFLFFSSFLWF